MTVHAFATPEADRLIGWPASFGRRFLVSVDVEEEFDWSLPVATAPRSVESVKALLPWHRTMRAAAFTPLYLVDYPIAQDDDAAAVLRAIADDGGAIGAQLHPWANPPHEEAADEPSSFAGNLPAALEAAKLDALFATIVQGIGVAPIAYRAGRYGIGAATAGLLTERGMKLDVSMRSRFDYSMIGGPDFRDVGAAAFRLDGVIEVPLTTIDIGLLRRWGSALDRFACTLPRGRGALARAGLLSRVPLTPEGVRVAEAERAIAVAAHDGVPLLQLAFHSPSLVPGNTPYVQSAADLARLHAWWDRVLAALVRHGYRPVSAAEIIAVAG